MMLTFTGQLDKILDGSKTMTTRLDAKDWFWNNLTKHLGTDKTPLLHMYWKNPRNRDPDGYKIGVVKCIGAWHKWGSSFTTDCARMDGFVSVEDYITALGELNDKNRMEVLNTFWTQIIWGNGGIKPDWLDGPHPRKVA